MADKASRAEETERLRRALELTIEAIALVDHVAPSAHSHLVSAVVMLKAIVAVDADARPPQGRMILAAKRSKARWAVEDRRHGRSVVQP